MALLDPSTYDLTTLEGQSQAISDIIDEFNTIPQDTELLNYFNIAAYGSMSLFVPAGSASGTYTTSATHGLNYLPAFLIFNFASSANAYSTLPSFGFGFNPINSVQGYRAYCDNQKIYAQYSSTSFPFDISNSFFYYIFNLPMPT